MYTSCKLFGRHGPEIGCDDYDEGMACSGILGFLGIGTKVKCPKDCVGEFESWSNCNTTNNTQTRTYKVSVAGNGKECPHPDSFEETRQCPCDGMMVNSVCRKRELNFNIEPCNEPGGAGGRCELTGDKNYRFTVPVGVSDVYDCNTTGMVNHYNPPSLRHSSKQRTKRSLLESSKHTYMVAAVQDTYMFDAFQDAQTNGDTTVYVERKDGRKWDDTLTLECRLKAALRPF